MVNYAKLKEPGVAFNWHDMELSFPQVLCRERWALEIEKWKTALTIKVFIADQKCSCKNSCVPIWWETDPEEHMFGCNRSPRLAAWGQQELQTTWSMAWIRTPGPDVDVLWGWWLTSNISNNTPACPRDQGLEGEGYDANGLKCGLLGATLAESPKERASHPSRQSYVNVPNNPSVEIKRSTLISLCCTRVLLP